MNKEYDELLKYIYTVERSQQQEEVRLAEEVARHKHTQQSIKNAHANIEAHKQSLEAMQSGMKSMRRQHMDEKKASKQLREATKHLKEELHMLDVSVQKASMDAGKKRGFYAKAIETAKERSHLAQLTYSRGQCSSSESAVTPRTESYAAEEDELNKKVEQLKTQLQAELDAIVPLKAKLAVVSDEARATEEARQRSTEAATARAQQVAEREAELLLQRNVVLSQKNLLEQQKKLQEDTVKEFHDLDEFGNKLSQTYEQLQQYCTELEAANSCARCAAKEGGEKRAQPQATEDPSVHDSGDHEEA